MDPAQWGATETGLILILGPASLAALFGLIYLYFKSRTKTK